MPITRDGTKRPREPLLQLSTDLGHPMCRIGRRLRSGDASHRGAILEIRPFGCLRSNALDVRTLLGGQFDWGGRLQKRNGGFQRCPRADW